MEPGYSNQTWTYTFHEPAVNTVRERSSQRLLPILLFAATVFSTVWAGCLHAGVDVFQNPLLFYKGLPFAFTLLLILGVHESGHYFMCRIHGIPSTVPYFIPMPNFLGTMGAFIRIKAPITTRRALLDIGMAGPLAGFMIALPATIIGFRLSGVEPVSYEESILLGQSILTWLIENVTMNPPPPGYTIALHPIGFAGYIGLFVTAMNLLPVGQLDGSHVISAMFGAKQAHIARITVIVLMFLGFYWQGWWIWGILLVALGLKHPVIRVDARPPSGWRTALAWLTIIIFIVTFIPVPFSFGTFTP
ncbi:site-2 protease family protein [bacterium]|nr:site-2 protease family protein [candidate division CSSED10-310 bacterium]